MDRIYYELRLEFQELNDSHMQYLLNKQNDFSSRYLNFEEALSDFQKLNLSNEQQTFVKDCIKQMNIMSRASKTIKFNNLNSLDREIIDSNDKIIQVHAEKRDMLQQEQDKLLDRIGENVGEIHERTILIANELDKQNEFIIELIGETTEADNRVKTYNERVEEIIAKMGNCCSLITIAILFVILVVSILLFFYIN